VHQYRHLTKIRNTDAKARVAAKAKSKESMQAHIAAYADLPEELIVKAFADAVSSNIIGGD